MADFPPDIVELPLDAVADLPTGPFPDLHTHPLCGLTFPWAEYISRSGSTFDASFGNDGVGVGMSILIYYEDLNTAIKELIGYTTRNNDDAATPLLVRRLPFAHPRWPQLWCTRITRCQGLQFTGKEDEDIELAIENGQIGGPVSEYNLILLTLQFSRPPYAVLSDTNPSLLNNGQREEWRRYTDRIWAPPNVQQISREGMRYAYVNDPGTNESTAAVGNMFAGAVGERLNKIKLTRTWYQIPQDCIYNEEGFPQKLYQGKSYTISTVVNNGLNYCLIIFYEDHDFIVGQTVLVNGVTGTFRANGTSVVTAVPSPSSIETDHRYLPGAYTGNPGTVSSFNLGSINIEEFMGVPPQTLLYLFPEIIIRPLPIPPELMGITDESVQLQYDVKFHFEYFDPPLGSGVTTRGWNNMPWAGDGLWYPVKSQELLDSDGIVVIPPRFPYTMTRFKELFAPA